MKRIVIPVIILLIWNAPSFGQDKKPGLDKKYDQTIYATDSKNKAKPDKLSQEAVDLAKKRMASFIVRCGKDLYIKYE